MQEMTRNETICQLYAQGATQQKLAEEFGVRQSRISVIVRGSEGKKKHLAYQRGWRARDIEKARERVRASQHKRRFRAVENLGGRCVGCGLDEAVVLEIDHINDDGKQDSSRQGERRASVGDIEGLQLLCGNCHNRKTRTGSYVKKTWVRGAFRDRIGATPTG